MLPTSNISLLSFCGTSCVSPMEFTDVTVDEVATILGSLDSRKAKGVDGIPAQFLKACMSFWCSRSYCSFIE